MDPGAMTVTPEEMAAGLSILTGFRASDLLGIACAFLALTEDDPRCKRIGQALWRSLEAEESGDHEALRGAGMAAAPGRRKQRRLGR